ncbi:DUF2237 domain-containing protein [Halobacteriales archaeon SW_7_68_16]|nr:MAG: DUF2237 domain-containing protein [Halobacteriales archaeon SW_7_68_16]
MDDDTDDRHNVHGESLAVCGTDPATGVTRDGSCRAVARDPGRHEVCAVMTAEFLAYSRAQGNDLVTPRPHLDFPGLEPGDRWCVCVPRWEEAREAGVAPPVDLAATNESVLDTIPLAVLEDHATEA